MDGLPEINRNPSGSASAESTIGAPPPPTEVKIRTMKADVQGLAASGGGLPRFESVKVSGLSMETKMSITDAKKNNAIMAVVITLIALIILAVLGYFGYKIVTGGI
ncbi:MAG TPA: hypothetical protein VMU07_01460 [Candidatus Paceibacterota bacterium]|nr:hypothetical protein [Candidatus Paceibacterota bacterium]